MVKLNPAIPSHFVAENSFGVLPVTCRNACENAGKLGWRRRVGKASAGARGTRLSLRNSNFKQQIRLDDLAARFARGFLSIPQPSDQRAQGMPGADAPAAKIRAKCATVTPESPGIPRAMVLRFSSCSPRRSGSFATVTCGTYRRLDTSVEMSGPHDFTVRKLQSSSARCLRPSHPAPTSRDVRETPLQMGRDAMDID